MATAEEEIQLKSNNSNTLVINEDKKQRKKFCSKQLDIFYDTLAIIISIFDVITDIWIMIEWFYDGRMVFFVLSLIILILANFAYLVVFFARYGELNPIVICCCGCLLLPIAPFFSFLIYIIDAFDINFKIWFFDTSTWNNNNEISKSREWMENKLSKHIGFLTEAIMEAFPQCILQMIAIVYSDKADIIAIISIIISMISISSKSLIFSAATSINIKTMIFTWFCFGTDIFGIFFILSFVFYGGTQIDVNIINLLREIWLYKLYIITLPTCFILSVPIYYWAIYKLHDKGGGWHMTGFTSCCLGVICFIFIIPLWVLGILLGSILLETLCYSYIGYVVYRMGHGRVPTNKSSKTWQDIIDWIESSKDRIVRVCCINRQLLLMKNNDNVLSQYLIKKEHLSQYKDVTYKSLNGLYINLFCKRFKQLFIPQDSDKEQLRSIFMAYYMISRLIVLIFPILIVIIMNYSNSLIYHLPLFQMIMLFIMFAMIFILIVLFCIIWKEEQIIFYILPLQYRLYMGIDYYLFVLVSSYYERLTVKPFIKIALFEVFGDDIGNLLYEFIPFELEEEEHSTQLRKRASQYTAKWNSNMIQSMVQAGFRRYFYY